jgi:glycosyltransferase involved in cell wall biosynthesis
MPTKVLDIDLAMELADIENLGEYRRALVLLRWRGEPLGRLTLDVTLGRIPAARIWKSAVAELGPVIAAASVGDLIGRSPDAPPVGDEVPSVSIVVCTRDRTEDLRACLDALMAHSTADAEIIVVDNAPVDDRTARLASAYPVRYAVEPRKGLNRARLRGAELAEGEIVAFVDDDVVVDSWWGRALLEPFADPEVAVVTGLVMPLELETGAQEDFEQVCGLGRGFERKHFTARTIKPLAAANVGTGACMAFRRSLLLLLSPFRAPLDGGTAARSGGDTYAFYRFLACGYRIVYQPKALVWHRHRRTDREVRNTLFGYSVGTYCFLLRCLFRHGEFTAPYVAARWFGEHHLREVWRWLRRRSDAQPLKLTLAETLGLLAAGPAYLMARWEEWRVTRRKVEPDGAAPGQAEKDEKERKARGRPVRRRRVRDSVAGGGAPQGRMRGERQG